MHGILGISETAPRAAIRKIGFLWKICSQIVPGRFVGNSGYWQIDMSTTEWASVRPHLVTSR